MVRFLLKHSLHAFSKHRLWMLLALVPPLIYLVHFAIVPDRFAVKQEISISGDDLVALSPRPGDLKALSELVSTPRYFFLNNFALMLLGKRLDMDMQVEGAQNPLPALKKEVESGLYITLHGQDRAVMTYDGKDRNRGQVMIGFYSQRLVKQAGDWLIKNRKGVDKSRAVPKLVGQITVMEQRSFWRSERLLPVVYLFFGSLILVLVIIAMTGWFTPSFRSERHMADYLKVPILGTLPDLKRITGAMKRVS